MPTPLCAILTTTTRAGTHSLSSLSTFGTSANRDLRPRSLNAGCYSCNINAVKITAYYYAARKSVRAKVTSLILATLYAQIIGCDLFVVNSMPTTRVRHDYTAAERRTNKTTVYIIARVVCDVVRSACASNIPRHPRRTTTSGRTAHACRALRAYHTSQSSSHE